jgi:hypothetical protein
MAEARYLTPSEHAEAVAASVLADDDARAQWDAGLLDVPADVAAVLDARLAAERRRSRDFIDADSVTVLHGD